MPLGGTENKLAEKIIADLEGTEDHKEAWKKVAKVILDHITANALVTGTTPNGGPLTDGKIT